MALYFDILVAQNQRCILHHRLIDRSFWQLLYWFPTARTLLRENIESNANADVLVMMLCIKCYPEI